MARRTKKEKNTCPEYNVLLRICSTLNSACVSENPAECDLRPGYKPIIKSPAIEIVGEKPKKQKDGMPTKPKLESIEEQLEALGVDPATVGYKSTKKHPSLSEQITEIGLTPGRLIKYIDSKGWRMELINVELMDADDPRRNIKPYQPLKVVNVIKDEWWDDAETEFCNPREEGVELCPCQGDRMWRLKKENTATIWICDYCHPSFITPSRAVKTISPEELAKIMPPPIFMPGQYFNQVDLGRF